MEPGLSSDKYPRVSIRDCLADSGRELNSPNLKRKRFIWPLVIIDDYNEDENEK
tara:strand:+ start:311 stop:472 length:162 start_codon:yes stop_codon:yes gene_type:complete